MDCWSYPLATDEEFQKLMIRINPPRYFISDLIVFGLNACGFLANESGVVFVHLLEKKKNLFLLLNGWSFEFFDKTGL